MPTPRRESFVLPGIGRVTVRRGETRQRAEKRARRNHGRKSLGLPVALPGIGTVRKRRGETFKQAERRVRRAKAQKSRRQPIRIFEGGEELGQLIIDRDPLESLPTDQFRGSLTVTMRIQGFRQKGPEFTGDDVPFIEDVTIDVADLDNIGVLQDALRRAYRTGTLTVIASIDLLPNFDG